MQAPFYEKLIPKKIRLNRLKTKIVQHLDSLPKADINPEQLEVLNYLKANILDVFPYEFRKKYTADKVEVFKDEQQGLYYMLWEGKKLYYKNGNRLRKAKSYFNSLLMEQDENSPHRYLTLDFDVQENDVLIDVGAAEGNFSLSVIEKASHVYIFETDVEWIEALMATFSPWKDKVTIVQKYVSDIDNGDCIRLDSYFAENQKINFIKADVEGAEGQVINGASRIIDNQKNLRIAVCTYHRQTDAKALNDILINKGFMTHFSDKYMIFHYGKTNIVEEPYLRKAILRGVKKDK